MPLIRSVESINDGFRIVKSDGTIITLTSTDLPKNVQHTNDPVQYENYMNTWIDNATKFTDVDSLTQHIFYAKVHVYSVNPMVAIAIVSDNPIVVDGWWL